MHAASISRVIAGGRLSRAPPLVSLGQPARSRRAQPSGCTCRHTMHIPVRVLFSRSLECVTLAHVLLSRSIECFLYIECVLSLLCPRLHTYCTHALLYTHAHRGKWKSTSRDAPRTENNKQHTAHSTHHTSRITHHTSHIAHSTQHTARTCVFDTSFAHGRGCVHTSFLTSFIRVRVTSSS
jgi:hypothetical protein